MVAAQGADRRHAVAAVVSEIAVGAQEVDLSVGLTAQVRVGDPHDTGPRDVAMPHHAPQRRASHELEADQRTDRVPGQPEQQCAVEDPEGERLGRLDARSASSACRRSSPAPPSPRRSRPCSRHHSSRRPRLGCGVSLGGLQCVLVVRNNAGLSTCPRLGEQQGQHRGVTRESVRATAVIRQSPAHHRRQHGHPAAGTARIWRALMLASRPSTAGRTTAPTRSTRSRRRSRPQRPGSRRRRRAGVTTAPTRRPGTPVLHHWRPHRHHRAAVRRSSPAPLAPADPSARTGAPAAVSPTTRSSAGGSTRSAAGTAYPSTAELANSGTSSPATTSSASTGRAHRWRGSSPGPASGQASSTVRWASSRSITAQQTLEERLEVLAGGVVAQPRARQRR